VSTTPNAHSGAYAWTCIDDQTYTGKDLDGTVDIDSPATALTFWHTWCFEGSTYDGGLLEISIDGGSTFQQLDSEIVEGGYTGTINTCCGNPLAGLPAWTAGSFGDMSRVRVDLSAFDGATGAVVRWRFGADSCCGPGPSGGWQIDDVSVAEPNQPCDGVNTPVLFVNRVAESTNYFDDMESGAGTEWSHGAPIGTDDWAITSTPHAHSASNAWTCIDDQIFTDKHLDLTVDLDAPYTDLWFWHTYYFESGQYDGAILEISTNGGVTFDQLDGEIYEGGYNGTIDASFGNPLGPVSAWTQGSFGSMTRVKVDLSAFDGTTGAILRFRFGADSCCGPGSLGGWQIDDVAIVRPGNEGTGGDDYTEDVGQDESFKLEIDEAPGNRGDGNDSRACVYAWLGAPGDGDVVILPKGLGPMCFGLFCIATKNPKKIWNAFDPPGCFGTNNMPNPPVIPDGGTHTLLDKPNGIGKVATATFQGIIEDVCSQATKPYSVTNGILVNITP